MIGFHGGFNTGLNINEATNFGFQDWLNLYISSKNNCVFYNQQFTLIINAILIYRQNNHVYTIINDYCSKVKEN